MASEVVLLDWSPSLFAARVRIALDEKEIEFESIEEDLINKKSPLLLKMNPVNKQIPVLIHKGRPICESLIIVEYIDEVWNHKFPLLPSDPYQRAHARFWGDYINKKEIEFESIEEDLINKKSPLLLKMNPVNKQIPVLIHKGRPICESLIIVEYIDKIYPNAKMLWSSKDHEVKEAAKKELKESFKVLEGELGDKPYYGGDTFGFVDLALIPFSSFFHIFETLGNFSVEAECPKLVTWAKRCKQRTSVSKNLYDQHKASELVLEIQKKFQKKFGVE